MELDKYLTVKNCDLLALAKKHPNFALLMRKFLHFSWIVRVKTQSQLEPFNIGINLIQLSMKSNYRIHEHQTAQDKTRIRYAAQVDNIYKEIYTKWSKTLSSVTTHKLNTCTILWSFTWGFSCGGSWHWAR